MRKRRRLVRATRLLLAMYLLIWCMTFTVCSSATSMDTRNNEIYVDGETLTLYGNPLVINSGGEYSQNTNYIAVGQPLRLYDEEENPPQAAIFLGSDQLFTSNNQTVNHAYVINYGNRTLDNVTVVFSGGTFGSPDSSQLSQGLIYNSTFSNNTAANGGAIYISDSQILQSSQYIGDSRFIYQRPDQLFLNITYNNAYGQQVPDPLSQQQYSMPLFVSNGSFSPATNLTSFTPAAASEGFINSHSEYKLLSDLIGSAPTDIAVWEVGNLPYNSSAAITFNTTVNNPTNITAIGLFKQDNLPHYVNASLPVYNADPVNVTFDPNDGSLPETRSLHRGDKVGKLPVPERERYVLLGWYTGKDSGTKISSSTEVIENVTWYAHWTPAPHALKFVIHPLSSVPSDLNTYSLPELRQRLMQPLVHNGKPADENHTSFYDAELLISFDHGVNWEKASEMYYPQNGISLSFPYPEGTGPGNSFCASQIMSITSDNLRIRKGDILPLSISKTADKLIVTLRGPFPFALSWLPTPIPDTNALPRTGDSTSLLPWMVLLVLCAAFYGLSLVRKRE